ncbi:glycoside hydrolase family 25 protein [Weeksella virosa]|uniref:Glycoside hydrolase family 25 n=1 Tax=Weeksella virosa (strain ATCC 43766 / DSM 16922 / JCM 21250 / CCUG 30538 / CDC 9751 / IAM 14551 / NBRC 16016 / NCTC 11634 / CL345/78) TaxID=865938 RepID=F0P0P9_WEEVC|nr:GH25 family lysozyme [Weeksella virosa]ADX68548.1 glycoside hydrolase family 25 [Weeksella virosa DSM 16922]VEH63793.1 Lysozyme M1 precursor [Weeksella virosa]
MTRKVALWVLAIFITILLLFAAYRLIKNPVYLKNKELTTFDKRNIELMKNHRDKCFGIDISQYQGEIHWKSVEKINHLYPINFVVVRASMGKDGADKKFTSNWKKAKQKNLIRGAYHYYRPDEESELQALNFIAKVSLSPGDLPPVLDIEEYPTIQTKENLIKGLKNWLKIIEEYYDVKPIIYSYDKYYEHILNEHFSDYPLWIANYNFDVTQPKEKWLFWQFSENGSVKGIKGTVDLNIFNGNVFDLQNLTTKKMVY